MPRRFVFDPPDRFAAIAVGEPGQRTFFLSATKGPATLNVALEKAQVALLAERIGELVEELARRGVERPPGGAAVDVLDASEAREDAVTAPPADAPDPVIEAFRVGAMSITYDGERRAVILDVHQVGEDEDLEAAPQGFEADTSSGADDDQDPGDVLRVHLTLDEALRFAQQAMNVVRAGRPPCPLCGEPLGPQGHVCARRNGYLM
jgi:uncharacterized repeat protein (TIGR03847 family)